MKDLGVFERPKGREGKRRVLETIICNTHDISIVGKRYVPKEGFFRKRRVAFAPGRDGTGPACRIGSNTVAPRAPRLRSLQGGTAVWWDTESNDMCGR